MNLLLKRYLHFMLICFLFMGSVIIMDGCSHTPLAIREYRFSDTERQKTVAIFLPGRGGSMLDLEHEGILAILRLHQAPVDVMSVDAGLWLYIRRTLLDRLESDIMPKVREGQYRNVWLIGNSMGGLGSLLYARDHPGRIQGIILLAPFLGDEPILKEIAATGGLLHWMPKDTSSDNYQRDVWIFLKACLQNQAGAYPRLFLLAGRDDRFHSGHRLLASVLSENQVYWADGGHDWKAWRRSFQTFMEKTGESLWFP